MDLLSQIEADLKTALLSKNQEAVSVLRLLKSELKNGEIAAGKPLTEPEVQAVIRREIKKRADSVGMYRQGGNPSQADQEEREATLLAGYLPEPPSEEQIQAFLTERLAQISEPVTPALKGQLMRDTISHFEGRADGKLVSTLVDRQLNPA